MKKTLANLLIIFSMTLVGGVAFADDLDSDGISDDVDNCPFVANPDQIDNNFNLIGDACDGDYDADGVPDASDNCWDMPNVDQFDLDGDTVGDLCDIDRDGDGYVNEFESTLGTDPDDFDTDNDNVTDYYDCEKLNPNVGIIEDCVIHDGPPPPPDPSLDPFGDEDDDGVQNGSDNCPLDFNPGQQDQDGDGEGDLCDNETVKFIELAVAEGGGGFVGCSFVPQAVSPDIGNFLFLMGIPFLAIMKAKKGPHKK
jgi:hypothetical protein